MNMKKQVIFVVLLLLQFNVSAALWKELAGAAVGGGLLVVCAPAAVGALGFGAGGIAAGSVGASMMSAMAPTAAGGVVAGLQSVGAAGIGVVGKATLGAAGSAIGAAVTNALTDDDCPRK